MIPSLALELEEDDDEEATGEDSTGVADPVSSEKSNLHFGHLIA